MILNVVLILFLIWTLVVIFVVTSSFVGFLRTRVPFVPTYTSDVEFFIATLGMSSKDVFYELGSGNGKVVFLVEKLSGARCKGFELTTWTHVWALLKKYSTGSKAQFVSKDFFKEDWSEATVLYGYLYPPLMKQVQDKFLSTCKPGTIAIIRDFPFPDLKPTNIYQRPKKHEMYIYKVN